MTGAREKAMEIPVSPTIRDKKALISSSGP
jgi:hypothetical protein